MPLVKHTLLIFSFLGILSFGVKTSALAQFNQKANELKAKLSAMPQKDTAYIQTLFDLCYEYIRYGNDSALAVSKESYDLSIAIDYASGEIEGLQYISSTYNEQSEYSLALDFAEKMLTKAEAYGDKRLISNAYNSLGKIYRNLNDYPMCIENYLKCLEIREREADLYGLASVSTNLGFAYQKYDDIENAELYLKKALDIGWQLKDTLDIITYSINMGVFYENNDQLDEAVRVYSDGIQFARLKKVKISEAICLGNLGVVYSKMGDYQKGLELLSQSLEIKKEINISVVSLAYVYFHFQTVFFRAGNYKASIENGEKVLRMLEKKKSNELVRRAYKYLEKAYRVQKAYDKAYQYREEHDVLNDSIFNAEKTLQVSRLQTLYETKKKDLMITSQNSEIDLLAAKNLYQSRLTWAVTLILLFFFAAFYFYRSKSFSEKAKRLQEKFTQQLLGYQEDERLRISRDLHDSIGQSLILIKNKVRLTDNSETSDMISDTLEEVRNISKKLHPVLLEKLGLTTSIQKMIDDVDSSTEIFLESELDNIDKIFTKEEELHIYRIIQEAVTNMVKHADTPSAKVTIQDLGKQIKCAIIDYGKGFDLTTNASQFQSLGMQTLKERTKILNGKLLVESTSGKGTSIVLVIDKPGA